MASASRLRPSCSATLYPRPGKDPFPSEQRRRAIGMVGTQVVMVVHTWPDFDTETGEEIGRIISARKATRREREAHEEGYY